jgi:hypothetical protein
MFLCPLPSPPPTLPSPFPCCDAACAADALAEVQSVRASASASAGYKGRWRVTSKEDGTCVTLRLHQISTANTR